MSYDVRDQWDNNPIKRPRQSFYTSVGAVGVDEHLAILEHHNKEEIERLKEIISCRREQRYVVTQSGSLMRREVSVGQLSRGAIQWLELQGFELRESQVTYACACSQRTMPSAQRNPSCDCRKTVFDVIWNVVINKY